MDATAKVRNVIEDAQHFALSIFRENEPLRRRCDVVRRVASTRSPFLRRVINVLGMSKTGMNHGADRAATENRALRRCDRTALFSYSMPEVSRAHHTSL